MWRPCQVHPAIAHLGGEDRARIVQAAWARVQERPLFWPLTILALLSPLFAIALAIVCLSRQDPGMFTALVAAQTIAVTDVLLWLRRTAKLYPQALQEELLAQGIRPEVCLVCKYDLRGANSPRCPECGTEVAI